MKGAEKVAVIIAMVIFFLCEAYLPVALRQMTALDRTPFLKMSWRAQTSCILLIPIAMAEAWMQGSSGWSQYLRTTRATLGLIGGLFGVGASWVGSFSLLSTSLKMTSLAHSTLCAVGMPPIFLTLYSIVVKREQPVLLELFGVALAVGGIAVAVQDAGEGVVTLGGDIVALGSALMAASFGLCISHVRSTAPNVPIFNFQLAWSTCALPFALALPILLGETDLGESLGDKVVVDVVDVGGPGLFDWMSGAYWPQMVFLAIGMGVVAQATIAFIVQGVGPLPYGLVMCACPAGSSVMGFLLGAAAMPGPPSEALGSNHLLVPIAHAWWVRILIYVPLVRISSE